ncbi:MAG TPA: helix-turn-helix domain-containing protein [Propionibacteriaceae bacterium]|nr:helix-turn-helix domain-containing protein [Propionibacteriaceae bacterium]
MNSDRLPDVMDPNCPSREVLRRIGERWTPLVIEALSGGPLRFTRLREAIGGVTPRVLTATLRGLEQDGLVTRTIYAEVPPRVEYTLTPLGSSLLEPIRVNRRWAETHLDEVLAARDRWDESRVAVLG